MTLSATVLDYLPDAADRTMFAQTPVLMMPNRGALDPLPVGRRRYVAASDGLYVQARHRALDLTLKLAEARLPFGPLAENVSLAGGLIPRDLYREIQAQAVAHHPNEWAGLVHWDEHARRYVLTSPQTHERSTGHIRYDGHAVDRERLVLDVHSHGRAVAFFSAEDNQSDEFGFHFASVLGTCKSFESVTVATRLVVDGHFFVLHWNPWDEE